jgi:hypothetical protein
MCLGSEPEVSGSGKLGADDGPLGERSVVVLMQKPILAGSILACAVHGNGWSEERKTAILSWRLRSAAHVHFPHSTFTHLRGDFSAEFRKLLISLNLDEPP